MLGAVDAPQRDDDTDWPAGLPAPVTEQPIGGGLVGRTSRAVLADGRVVVVKRCPYPVAGEVDGLAALAAAGVPTPAVLGASNRVLVLEHVHGEPDWPALGAAIARLHRVGGEAFGWHRDNHSGRFPQHNPFSPQWPEFFTEHRVRVHLSDPRLPGDFRRRLERACDGPLPAELPDEAIPVLTHGDLWTGNIVDGRWVVDPEVSFADRELDLAYMLGPSRYPLPAEFWAGYTADLPLPVDFERRALVLGLHHRLLHVRHFGDRALPALDADLTALGW